MGILDFFGLGNKNKDLIKEAKRNGALIIDVRTVKEYKQGHVKDSVNIPLDVLSSRIDELKGMKKPLLMCCASGMRSGSATVLLKKNGIECYNAGSWSNLG
jgi:rhodanese-related sulfurtransferase